ncbi:MAG: tyrosine-type recombinase/integrase [Chloroherpetonaceae bacterium]|nr:site-specific integrase [Chthonomonadaceae bacterium]MDW8206677.1 tyrosine-type recombinase/integrase [Chloroherpetonaceae bacterium]
MSENTVERNMVMTPATPADLLGLLLAEKRSENTRRAYRYDLTDFFMTLYGRPASPALLQQFLSLNTPQMVGVIMRYKTVLLERHLSEATVNRRLSAIMSLIRLARKLGATQSDPSGFVATEKVVAYRDTRGITPVQARLLLHQPDRSTLKGKRDYALLRLLLENALRRAEALAVRVADFNPDARTLAIRGKGRGTQQERITLSAATVAAILDYQRALPAPRPPEAPLFINVSPGHYGKQLTPDGLYKTIRALAEQAGLDRRVSPHRLRHTAITMALDASGGDIRRVQRLSRHARLETLQIYDDNRANLQGQVTELLATLLHEDSPRPPQG